jgi:TPR repeat protein
MKFINLIILTISAILTIGCTDKSYSSIPTNKLVEMSVGDNEIMQVVLSRANEGDPIAQFSIAPLYYVGALGFPINKKKALELWSNSCELGVEASCRNLEGIKYSN